MVVMGEAASVTSTSEPTDRPSVDPSTPSFEDFFQTEHLRLLRALYLLTGDPQEAEELTQDAFLALWEKWDRVRGMEEPTGYLYRTAMNRQRSKARRIAHAARRMTGAADAGDAFAAADERDAVARALSRLTPRQRAAVILTEMLGYGAEDAAGILGVQPPTVRSLASQGRATMREVLNDD
jgi:RNA polymerase sigma factor (sigma-70 family)